MKARISFGIILSLALIIALAIYPAGMAKY